MRGYGDALWRGLSVAEGDVVLFLDPSVPDPEGRRALGLLGPLLSRQNLSFVKGFSTRTNGAGGLGPEGLSELVARPLINLYRPELAGFVEPLSPEFAARRTLLASLSFPAGYGAALSLLLDAAKHRGRTSPRPNPPRPASRNWRVAARPRRSRLRDPRGRRGPYPRQGGPRRARPGTALFAAPGALRTTPRSRRGTAAAR